MPSTNVFNVSCVKITAKKKILTGICYPVYFRLCIDLMDITPSVTAEGFDDSDHPRYAEWKNPANQPVNQSISHLINQSINQSIYTSVDR